MSPRKNNFIHVHWKGLTAIFASYALIFTADCWFFRYASTSNMLPSADAAFDSSIFIGIVTIVFIGITMAFYGEQISNWFESKESSEADILIQGFIEEQKRRDRENPAPDLDDYVCNVIAFFRRHLQK